MKLSIVVSILLPLAVVAKDCTNVSGNTEGCDWDPFHAQRRTDVTSGRRIHPTCYITNGRSVNGNKKWVWIMEWGCWLSSKNTNTNCESGSSTEPALPICDGLGSDG